MARKFSIKFLLLFAGLALGLNSCSKNNNNQNAANENAVNSEISPNSPARPAPSASEIESKIIGTWVLYGEDCDSGATFNLDDTHDYGNEDETGTWKIAGQKIEIAINQTDKPQPIIYALNVMDISDTNAILQRADGSNVEWQKCALLDAHPSNQEAINAK